MRRFRFVGDPSGYNWKINPIKGEVYDFDRFKKSHGDCYSVEVFECFHAYEDWQEVFDEPKPLHKDTDLGMFSAMFVGDLLKSSKTPDYHERIVSDSILLAKELIKQLNEETK